MLLLPLCGRRDACVGLCVHFSSYSKVLGFPALLQLAKTLVGSRCDTMIKFNFVTLIMLKVLLKPVLSTMGVGQTDGLRGSLSCHFGVLTRDYVTCPCAGRAVRCCKASRKRRSSMPWRANGLARSTTRMQRSTSTKRCVLVHVPGCNFSRLYGVLSDWLKWRCGVRNIWCKI